jgi:hypothetical protein
VKTRDRRKADIESVRKLRRRPVRRGIEGLIFDRLARAGAKKPALRNFGILSEQDI